MLWRINSINTPYDDDDDDDDDADVFHNNGQRKIYLQVATHR